MISVVTPAARTRFPEILGFDVLDSTNDELRRRVLAGSCRDGTVILAERQTGGKGRLGRPWESPAGNLHLSLARRMHESNQLTATMTLVAGQALAMAVEGLYGLEPTIKWPNDLLLDDRKLAGILVEGVRGWQIIGVGVNVDIEIEALPVEVQDAATALRDHTEAIPDPSDLAGGFLDAFTTLEAEFLSRGALDMKIWEQYWGDRGRRCKAWLGPDPLEGVPEEVTPLGALMMRDDDGCVHEIRSSEILHLRWNEGRTDVPCD